MVVILPQQKLGVIGIGSNPSNLLHELNKNQNFRAIYLNSDRETGDFVLHIDKDQPIANSEDMLAKAVQGLDSVVILTYLGSESGCGLAPLLGRHMQNLGLSVTLVVTVPFEFEGKKRQTDALNCLSQIQESKLSHFCLYQDNLLHNAPADLSLEQSYQRLDAEIKHWLSGYIHSC